MKVSTFVLVVAVVLLTFVGVALAGEMSGTVTAVNAEKNTITLKSQTMDVSYDCEDGTLLKGVKVGDEVTVEYKGQAGKKMATKINPMKKNSANNQANDKTGVSS